MTLFAEARETFLPGDYRNELKGWIKRNCPEPSFRYVKGKSALYRVIEDLSLALVRRRKWGLQGSRLEHEIKGCGKSGECQKHKGTKETRFIGHYCNHRTFHIPCAIRYRAGQGIELKNQFMEIATAQDLWGFYNWTFTLPDTVRAWIDDNENTAKAFLQDVRRAVSKTIKASMGLNTKTRNIQPGFSIIYHPSSSGNPFKQASHFHAIILPLLVALKKKMPLRFKARFDHATVKAFYKKYLDKVFSRYGLQAHIRDAYVVHLYDVDRALDSSVNHAFKYVNRSQAEDVLKTIKRVSDDFEEFVCVLLDKAKGLFVPCLKSKKEVLEALEKAMNPVIPIRLSYGFMRVIERYSETLKVERDDYHDDENWQTLYLVEMRRMAISRYNKALGKVVTIFEVWVRRKDSNESFRHLSPYEVRGERACLSSRKLFKARRA